MDDVFGTGQGLSEPSDEELGIGIDEPAGTAPEVSGDEPDGDGVDDGADGEPAGREEHPQGRAFRTMREKLAASERENQRLREVEKDKIRYEERMRMFVAQRQEQEAHRRAAAEAEAARRAAAADPEPNREEDLLAWQDWRLRQLDQRLNLETQAREAQAAEVAQQARVQTIQRIANEYTMWENRFALEAPDYRDAFNFIAAAYAQEYRLRGVPEDQLMAALEAERARVIQSCLAIDQASGTYQWVRNPAQVIYETARMRGYGAQPMQPEGGYEEQPPRQDPRAARLGRSVAAAGRNGAPGRSVGAPRSAQPTLEWFNNLEDGEAARFMEQYPELAQELLSPHG